MTGITPESLAATVDETRKPDEPPEPEEQPVEFEWKRVASWPPDARIKLDDIEDIEVVLKALRTPEGRDASEELLYTKAVSLLRDAVLTRRLELCEVIFRMHDLELP